MKLLVALLIIGGIWWLGQRRRETAALSPAEARELLGVSSRADETEIRAAHRRLIGRVHPDAGGSAALAGRVNAARDVLVQELRTRASPN